VRHTQQSELAALQTPSYQDHLAGLAELGLPAHGQGPDAPGPVDLKLTALERAHAVESWQYGADALEFTHVCKLHGRENGRIATARLEQDGAPRLDRRIWASITRKSPDGPYGPPLA